MTTAQLMDKCMAKRPKIRPTSNWESSCDFCWALTSDDEMHQYDVYQNGKLTVKWICEDCLLFVKPDAFEPIGKR